MRIIFSLLFCIISLTASAATYYISPNGNDNNPGTITAPWANWSKLETVKLQPGDIVYIRGGIYRTPKSSSATCHVIWNGFHGTSDNNIKIWAYPGESPVLNFDNIITKVSATAMEILNCSYIHIKGLRVTGLAQPNSTISLSNWALINVTNSTVENCRADHSGMYGFSFGNGCNTLLIKNCDADNLADISMGGANGFNITGGSTATNIAFYGCRAWFNSDDGWDFYKANGYVTIDNCWAFWNGYDKNFNKTGDGVGFKLGPTTTNQTKTRVTIRNSLAIHNKQYGFNQNTVNTYNPVILYNNVSYDNGNYGYMFGWGPSGGTPSIFRNNISYLDGSTFVGESVDINDHNSWNGGVTVNSSDFQSLDTTGISGPRKADGSLPDLKLLKLVSTSDLIDKGINVGLPYSGTAPDIGAYETVPIVVQVNQSPVVSISSPVKNASFTSPATITITATASDPDGSITKVEFYQGTAKIGEKATSPYSFTWNEVPEGTWSLTAVATDNANSKTVSAAVSITVVKPVTVENKLPIVSISSPTNSSSYIAPATITINAAASDPDGTIVRVEFFQGNVKIGEIATSPYSFTWKEVPEGTWSLTAVATDNANSKTVSAAVSITVVKPAPAENKLPIVSISSPAKGSSFIAPATVTIDATASDPDGTIVKVEFFQGNVKIGEKATSPYSFTWKEVPEGTWSLTAVATDNANSKTISAAVSITVGKPAAPINESPLVSISSPTKGISYTAPANVTIEVNASDPDGSITKVELFNGSVKLYEKTAAPYSFSLKDLPAGSYELKAVATDNMNAIATSSYHVLTVTPILEARDYFNLYPNPNDGRFSIEFTSLLDADIFTVTVVDLIGKTVYREELSKDESTRQFDLSHLQSGVYVLMISANAIILTQKFIKG